MARAATAVRKPSGKAAKYHGVVGRKDMVSADPDDLVIVDTPGHPLYQPARNTKPLDESMIQSLMGVGLIQPLKAIRGPMVKGRWKLLIVYGRQRVRNAREANRRLRADGLQPLLLEVVIIDRTADQLRAMMEEENTQRTYYTPYELATTAAESLARGHSEAVVLNRSFKGDKVSMRRHLDLLRCAEEVQRAIVGGVLNFKTIDDLVKLSHADQVAEVTKLQAAGLTGPRQVRASLITDHPDLAAAGNDGADAAEKGGDRGEEPKTRTKSTAPKARNAQEIADRLAALEQLPPMTDESEELAWAIRVARVEELKWALRDDEALATASADDLGGWVSSAEEAAAKKEADKAAKQEAREKASAEKAAERLAAHDKRTAELAAAKVKAKADKEAAREAARQAARDEAAAEAAKVQAKKDAAATKRASKANAKQQLGLDDALPKVTNRGGTGRKGRGK